MSLFPISQKCIPVSLPLNHHIHYVSPHLRLPARYLFFYIHELFFSALAFSLFSFVTFHISLFLYWRHFVPFRIFVPSFFSFSQPRRYSAVQKGCSLIPGQLLFCSFFLSPYCRCWYTNQRRPRIFRADCNKVRSVTSTLTCLTMHLRRGCD